MGKFIAIHVLKQYNPGTFNRGEDGEAKQIICGGSNRVRFSSQCQKRAIREMMGVEEIRTAEPEKIIDNMLDVKIQEGTLAEKDKDFIGKVICSKSVIGADCWEKLKETKEEKNDNNDDNEDNEENVGEKKKGRVTLDTNSSELEALVNTFTDVLAERGKNVFKKAGDCKKIAQKSALNDVAISKGKALFGSMATDGAIGTVDGAVQMANAFSLDLYRPDNDLVTAKGVCRVHVDESDPFFGSYASYGEMIKNKRNAETMQNGLSLYSNLMYEYANVNIPLLLNNRCTFIGTRQSIEATEEIKNEAKELIINFVNCMIAMVPAGAQNRSASYVEPTAVLIEVIDNGTNEQAIWSKVLDPKDGIIDVQAIKHLSGWANNRINLKWSNPNFNTTIKQYVMFGTPYEDFGNLYKAQKLNSLAELAAALDKDLNSLM